MSDALTIPAPEPIPLTTRGGTKLIYVGSGTWRDTLRIKTEDGYVTDVLIADLALSDELTRILNPETP